MKVGIISSSNLAYNDVLEVTSYNISYDIENSSKSDFELYRRPNCFEGDFLVANDTKSSFIGIISKIEQVSDSKSCKLICDDLVNLFDRRIILGNSSLLATGVEDFIASEINANFVSNADSFVNLPYLKVTAKTHNPIADTVEIEEGNIYNLKSYINKAVANYGVSLDFKFEKGGLALTIVKDEHPQLKIDTTITDVSSVEETSGVEVLSKITAVWQQSETVKSTKDFFLTSDGRITEDKTDSKRLKGNIDVIYSTAENLEVLKQEVADKFKANEYNHKITFELLENSKIIPRNELKVGRKCLVKTLVKDSPSIKPSIITEIKYSSENSKIGVTLGQMKVTLVDKLKGGIL